MNIETARAALANTRAAIEARIMDIEAEGRRRVSSGRSDFVEMVAPRLREEEGLAVVFALELMLADAKDAPPELRDMLVKKIVAGLAPFTAKAIGTTH
jgi:hypothetical protein